MEVGRAGGAMAAVAGAMITVIGIALCFMSEIATGTHLGMPTYTTTYPMRETGILLAIVGGFIATVGAGFLFAEH